MSCNSHPFAVSPTPGCPDFRTRGQTAYGEMASIPPLPILLKPGAAGLAWRKWQAPDHGPTTISSCAPSTSSGQGTGPGTST